jgi:transglutaminase-like putative cysteine protease
MPILSIRHVTTYHYNQPVDFGEHRMMLRPRDSHDLRLIKTNFTFSPPASVRWMHDVFGNSVAMASFSDPSTELRIESDLVLETFAAERPPFQITPDALRYPFIYSADDRIDLGRLLERHYPDPNDQLGSWARGFVRSNPTDTSALLADLNSGVAAQISYQSRETEGTQTPVETLNRGWGSGRDLAVLLIDAARSLGFGARVVTGYLYRASAGAGSPAAIGAGTTHAWADIYLPGSGWISYDPTNGTIGGRDLIQVAVTRVIGQAVPITGSFVGPSGSYLGMTVDVNVKSDPAVLPERRFA